MVADLLNSPTGAIHFRLLITSCDCNITTSVSSVCIVVWWRTGKMDPSVALAEPLI